VPAGQIRNLLIDSAGRLWVPSYRGGLSRIDENLQIDNRFISVTASRDTDVMVVNIGEIAGNMVTIYTALNHDTNDVVFQESPAQFTIFIF